MQDASGVANSPFASGGKLRLHHIQKRQPIKLCRNSINTNSFGPNLLTGFGGALSKLLVKKEGLASYS